MAVLGDHLFYINGPVNVGVNTWQMQLWRTDGSAAGTEMVASTSFYNEGLITPGGVIAVFNNRLYFQFNTPTDGELWRSDGTPQGTEPFVDINPSGKSYPSNFFEFDGSLFFTANHPDTGYELWVTDGTEEGTHLFMDVVPGPYSNVNNLTSANNTLFFTAMDTAGGTRLWKSDGTPIGTETIDVIKATTPFQQNTIMLTAVGDRLFFFAKSNSTWALWVTDGTLAGTQWLHDMSSSSLNNSTNKKNELAVVSGQLFFGDDYMLISQGSSSSLKPTELWVSDGTAGGTNLVKEVSP